MAIASRRNFLGGAAGAAGLAATSGGRAAVAQVTPDLVLHNARIWTVSDALPEAQALAIAGGRILALGSNADILGGAPAGVRRVDLGGKRVTPGFVDAHAHPIESGVQLLLDVACDSTSLDEIKTRLRRRAEATPKGEWIRGFLYDDAKTERPLTTQDLDEAAPAHPVIVTHRGGHTGFVNSLAYARAKVDAATPDPAGGRYFRDTGGRLNGRVADAAKDVFERLAAARPTRDDQRRGAALISKMFSAKGVTSAVDASGSPEGLQGYLDALEAGELRMRVYCHMFDSHLEQMTAAGLHSGFGDEWVRLGAIKLFSDGSISERTAWMSQPYLDVPGDYRGIQVQSRERLYARAKQAHLAGWQIGVHANGDLAIDETLGVFEQLQREAPRRDPRFRIEHCTLVNDDLVRRMKAVGAVPVPFAGYVYFHGDVMHYYGKARTEHMFAMRSLIDAGLAPASSSDYTASPSDPMMWMQSQITRADPAGQAWGPSQRISAAEAIRCGTLNGARSTFEEGQKGSLAPGKAADLAVWREDPLSAPPSELVKNSPERVMAGGRWVFEA
jgi:predicted amidohydrolase YtcJ